MGKKKHKRAYKKKSWWSRYNTEVAKWIFISIIAILIVITASKSWGQGGTSAFGTGNTFDPDGGGTLSSAASVKVATPFFATFDGTLDSMSLGMSDSGDPDSVYFFVYSDNTGEPNTLLATSTDSAHVTGGDTDEAYYTLAITTDIVAGTTYWLGAGNSAGSDINMSRIRTPADYSRTYVDLRPYDASWNTGGDITASHELNLIAYYTVDDSIRHLWPSGEGGLSDLSGVGDAYQLWSDPARHDDAETEKGQAGGTFDDVQESVLLPDWTDVGGDAGDNIDSVILIMAVMQNASGVNNEVIAFSYDGSNISFGTVFDEGDLGTTHDSLIVEKIGNPDDGSDNWTVTDIDNLQIGINVSLSFPRNIQCTQLHARVYYHVEEAVSPLGRRRKIITQ